MKHPRMMASALSLSMAAFIGLVAHEGYTDRAIAPTVGDRPTVGFGSTFHADGSPVQMDDTITPVAALQTAQAHIAKDERVLRESLGDVAVTQGEYDVYAGWLYQYGPDAWLRSPMLRNLRAGEYTQACAALLDYRYITDNRPHKGWEPYRWNAQGAPTRWKFDCSTPGNKLCRGVWTRQVERHARCMDAQP